MSFSPVLNEIHDIFHDFCNIFVHEFYKNIKNSITTLVYTVQYNIHTLWCLTFSLFLHILKKNVPNIEIETYQTLKEVCHLVTAFFKGSDQ
jgi:hypothetical protein